MVGMLCLLLVVYAPVLRGGFVWDDTVLIERNALVTGQASLASIWFAQDFPLSLVALWLQWLAWGMQPPGYHLVNVLLHAAGALLLWRLLARFRVPAPGLAAVLFAVHPVAVASVAWISEIKNTLSLPFFLASALTYLQFEKERLSRAAAGASAGAGVFAWYWASLCLFTLALLSKTSTVMLPVALLICLWWQDRRAGEATATAAGHGNRVSLVLHGLRLAPFFALALTFGLLTLWFQSHQVLSGTAVEPEPFWTRLAGAGRALWFYLGKALLPVNLTMIYPRWEVQASSPAAWLPLGLWIALLATTAAWRRATGRALFAALGCFTALLFPVLGLFHMYFLAISRVSDHFAYLALIPVVALAAGAVESLTRRFAQRRAASRVTLFHVVAGAAVLTLACLSFQRARVFASDEALWRDTLARNPAAWTAHNNLGCLLAEKGQLDGAAHHFTESLRLNPNNAEAHRNLGRALMLLGRHAAAEEHLRAAVRLKPRDAEARRLLASALMELGRPAEAVESLEAALRQQPDAATRVELAGVLRRLGRFRDAAAELRRAVAAASDNTDALGQLAWLLATAPDPALRNGPEAVELAERACRLTGDRDATLLGVRAAACAEAGRFAEAVASAEKAVALASASGNTNLARLHQQLLRLYRARLPYREPAVGAR